jgi:outer membrane lipoprotein-sorting protein
LNAILRTIPTAISNLFRHTASFFAFAAPLLLSGCSLLPSTRKLPVPKAPANVQTVDPEQLVAQLNQRWQALETLNAKVTIQASQEKRAQGLEQTEPTFPAVILLRKPEMLRVYGRVPVLGTPMFDMASDGTHFTIYVPSRKEALTGSNALQNKSANAVENLRPGFFFDAMVVKGIGPDDFYSVTSDSETIEDPSKKHLLLKPEYILNVLDQKPNSHQVTTMREVIFDRSTLLPYEQDVYSSDGIVETQVLYSGYRDFDGVQYPSTITIKRPVEGTDLVLTVLSVNQNQTLKDDQFVVTYPADTQIKNLDTSDSVQSQDPGTR